MADLGQQIAELSPAQLQALRDKLAHKRKKKTSPSALEIAREPRDRTVFPLSFPQLRLWFHQRLHPGNTDYNLFTCYDIEDRVDYRSLVLAVHALAERHEVLRTSFTEREGQPVQIIQPQTEVEIRTVDLSALNERQQSREVLLILETGLHQPFDLEQGPLLRTTLVSIGSDRYLLDFFYPHIISDAWSQELICLDFDRIYQALLCGETPSPAPEDALRYADYACWQRRSLTEGALTKQLAYWKELLGESPPALKLPTDRPRTAALSAHGARQSWHCRGELRDRLRRLARHERVSLMVPLLAAFQLLLHCYSGQDPVLVGSPWANRDRRETQKIVGFFVNMLVLATRISERVARRPPTFRQLVARVKEVYLGACSHPDVPFEKLVEELHPERDLNHNPFFEVVFNYIPTGDDPNEQEAAKTSDLERMHLVAPFDLSLVIQERAWGLLVEVDYKLGLFDRTTIQRFLGHYRELLERMVRNLDQPISEVSPFRTPERHLLLREWSESASPSPREVCVHQLFETRAAKTPEAVAVVDADGAEITYGELNVCANRIAHALLGRGVGPEVAVGIVAERGPEMIAGVLGILKAGGAYVPLDPDHPPERLRDVLRETRALTVLGSASVALDRGSIPAPWLDIDGGEITGQPEENPVGLCRPENLVYILFTSGSSGRPKGVCATHLGVARLIQEGCDFEAGTGDVFLQFAPLAFDASTFEIWGALTRGARLELAPSVPSPRELAGFLQERGITHMWLTAELFHIVVREAVEKLAGVRHLVAGGDVLAVECVEKVLSELPDCRLTNGYGPTENTTFSTLHHVTRATPLTDGVPLGRPISNSEVYILDSYAQAVPAGVHGELCCGGAGLARGYLCRRARTAESFVPHPFCQRPGERLYRTGDVGRYLADGTLTFLGRRDRQLKIRGFRIELGEIEARLTRHPGIEQAVVVVSREGGEKQLSAFLEMAERGTALEGEAAVRAYLRQHLPAPMIPGSISFVDRWPLSDAGKIDRAALTRTVPGEQETHNPDFDLPRSPIEAALVSLFRQHIHRDRIGIRDNFFFLGGHSLLATQVLSAVRETYGVEIPLRFFFEHPTVAELARAVATGRGAESAPPITPVDRDRPLGLSFAQERLWFLDRLEPGSSQYNIAELMELDDRADLALLRRSLNALVMRHETLRTRFIDLGERTVQRIDPPSPVPLPAVDLSALGESTGRQIARRIASHVASQAFDLERGPLMRPLVLRLERDVLFVALHHIIADGWSLRVMGRELKTMYRALVRGERDPLPALRIQYADYADWQRRWFSSGVLKAQLDYWRERLKGAPQVLQLPTDRPRPSVQSFSGAVMTRRLSPELTAALRRLSRQRDVTLYMTLLAGIYVLLHRYSGQEDLVVGSPIANRNRAETEGLIGFFVNTLLLRADLGGRSSFGELLAQVREVTLGAYDHQDLPFEILVDELAVERDLSSNPLFQVLFDFHTDLESVDESWDLDRDAAICDLSLSVLESSHDLLLGAEYSDALFDRTTVARMLRHCENLLAAVAAQSAVPVADLSFLAAPERHQLKVEWNPVGWNPGGSERSSGSPAHRQIVERASQAPHAIAAVCADEYLTYGALARRGRRLGRSLRGFGVERGTVVGIALPRSSEMLVAILGVLEAGGAYVPLDPAERETRLARIAAEVEILLTRGDLELDLAHPRTLWVDEERRLEDDGDRGLALGDQDLAYVIYTSGSTGRPKGVMIEHGALRRYAEDARRQFGLGPGDRVLQLAHLGFDVTVEEIFPTLLAGATLVLIPDPRLLSTGELTRLVASERLTGFEIPTHLWSEWAAALAEGGERLAPSLRYVITGTERVIAQHLRQWCLQRVPLVHVYGLTETAVTSLSHRFEGFDRPLPKGFRLPVGRPRPHTRIYLLDAALKLVPPGAIGELHLGGFGLGRGYLGEPGLTASRFIPDPHGGGSAGGRLYRSGDMLRFQPDGELVFLGRSDHQVKIRGFRIEPGEIEAALARHPAVVDACVLARDDLPGGRALVAFAVVRSEGTGAAELRAFLEDRLPRYMIPAAVVLLAELPMTSHGKIDRRELLARKLGKPVPKASFTPPRGEIERQISNIWREVLELDQVGVEENFFDLGGNSLLLLRVHSRLQQHVALDREFSLVELFRYPTVRSLAETFRHIRPEPAPAASAAPALSSASTSLEVAIIGMAGRFPGAPDVETFWRNLREGKESVSFFSDEELLAAGIPRQELEDPSYVKARAVLSDIDLFDAEFFAMSAREAEILDPQQRLFLETSWTALEHAGYDPGQFRGRIGVYAGSAGNSYYFHNLLHHRDLLESVDETRMNIANTQPFLATRVSYKLGLTGPSIHVQTACSTSLVAVVEAHQSLLQGQCDMVLAGGVAVNVPQAEGYLYREGGIMSPDGHCRAFDAETRGTVGGEGVGVVVLKRLADAVADGDTLHAIIRGCAINNDGSAKVGFTAPGIDGQADVIARAQEMAGVEPRTIGYIEAHGTGTRLGDATEIAALTQAFHRRTEERGFCALGSVKANIGHADDAAGIAGLIKTVQALKHAELPPSLHFKTPNPELHLDRSPFYISSEARSWEQKPRRAGVSSFGIGGTNAHVVLEQAPAPPSARSTPPAHLWVLSARTASALERKTDELVSHLESHPGLDPSDVACTLQLGRRAMPYRRAVVCRGLDEGLGALKARDPRRLTNGHPPPQSREVAFLFPGQGAQEIDMGRDLLREDASFRESVERCCEILEPHLGLDLRTVLYPGERAREEAARLLERTEIAQPALFVFEYALAQGWMSRGIEPVAMLGHSVGEYVAACLAGVFSLADALALIARRGRLMQSLPPGSMTGVPLPPEELEPLLGDDLALAAINAPARSVVSGTVAGIEAFETLLKARGIAYQRLSTTHAFHSPQVEPIVAEFRRAVASVERKDLQRPYLSNVSGTWITAEQACDPEYWGEHLRRPVQFAAALRTLLEGGDICLLEVGPGETLTRLAWRQRGAKPAAAVASLGRSRSEIGDSMQLMRALGRLWLAGLQVDWRRLHPQTRRLPLPTYPFERQRYWIDPAPEPALAEKKSTGKNPEVAEWLYLPSWKRVPLPSGPVAGNGAASPGGPDVWLIFADQASLGEDLGNALAERGQRVVKVAIGQGFAEIGEDFYEVHPTRRDDYRALMQALAERGCTPQHILHFWSVAPLVEGTAAARFEAAQERGFLSLLRLVQALDARGEPEIVVVSSHLHEVAGVEELEPEKATLLGICRVLAQERPMLRCRSVDLLLPQTPVQRRRLILQLLEECSACDSETVVAYRGLHRWVETFERWTPDPGVELSSGLRQGAVYLLNGGLGRLGLALAGVLAKKWKARLALVGRTALPPRSEWESYLEDPSTESRIAPKIRQLSALEEEGAEVLVLTADVADRVSMAAAFQTTREHFGEISGVFHLAGISDDAHYLPIQETERGNVEQHFVAKVHGLLVLEELLAETEVDFCLFFSSLASVLGGLGYASYAAANLFADAYVHQLNRAGGVPWYCVDWDGWMVGETPEDSVEGGHLRSLAMDVEEGMAAIEHILAQGGLSRVAVSTADLEPRIDQWIRLESLERDDDGKEASLSRHSRPELSCDFVAPRNEFEHDIAELWQELLGVDRVGIYDNFFELGGDSLVAIHLSVRLLKKLGVELTGTSLFEAQTIAEQTVLIVQKLAEEVDDERLAEILEG